RFRSFCTFHFCVEDRFSLEKTYLLPTCVCALNLLENIVVSASCRNTPGMSHIFPVQIEDKLMERDVSERSMSVYPLDDEDFFDQPDVSADSIEVLCETIRHEIKLVTFRNWFSHGHRMRILRCRLTNMVAPDLLTIDHPSNATEGITTVLWNRLRSDPDPNFSFEELCRYVYFGNCDPSIRKQVWPYLLGIYPWDSSETELNRLDLLNKQFYMTSLQQWQACETYLKKVADQTENRSTCCQHSPSDSASSLIEAATFELSSFPSTKLSPHGDDVGRVCEPNLHTEITCDGVESTDAEICGLDSAPSAPLTPVANITANPTRRASNSIHFEFSAACSGNDVSADSVSLLTSPPPISSNPNSNDGHSVTEPLHEMYSAETLDALSLNLYRIDKDVSRCDRNHSFFANTRKSVDVPADIQSIPSPDQSELNVNLQKLRNIICTWVWLHLDAGYVQGMCDLLAPLLIILEDEALAFACFCSLMEWMLPNFPLSKSRKSSTRVSDPEPLPMTESQSHRSSAPAVRPTLLALAKRYSKTCSEPASTVISPQPISLHTTDSPNGEEPKLDCTRSPVTTFVPTVVSPYGTSVASQKTSHMDLRFANLKSLIEIFDPKLHKYLCKKSIDTHFYFCYRWLLLDFKRELKYDEVFSVWEIIWASRRIVCYDLGVFFAMAMLQYYRDIIIYYDMDLTEIIRFYNELTEQHDVRTLLELSRSFVFQMQKLMIDR
ncbi:small G protein signaling modulator 2, partial [Paragonimus westermani]